MSRTNERLLPVLARACTIGAVATLVAACSGGGLNLGDRIAPLAAAPSGRVAAAPLNDPAGPQQPPIDMAGRWTLASTNGGACGMNFGAAPGAGEGTIAPEGGCPGTFFTSRKWTYERDGLIIRDHRGQPLGQLAIASPAQLNGQATTGLPITLTR
jgi:hypothetical protein